MIKEGYGLIFDCDGTLTISEDNVMISFLHALHKMGVDKKKDEVKKLFGVSGDKILIRLLESEEKGMEAFGYFLEHQRQQAPTTRLHTGIPKAINELIAMQVPLGIVTGRHTEDLRILLEPHQLIPHFKVMLADSQLSKPKPDPEGLLRAAEEMGVDVRKTMYIGDSPSDIQAAHAAGAGSIAVLWDSHANEGKLRAQKPMYVIHHPSEIHTAFEDFIRKQNIPETGK